MDKEVRAALSCSGHAMNIFTHKGYGNLTELYICILKLPQLISKAHRESGSLILKYVVCEWLV